MGSCSVSGSCSDAGVSRKSANTDLTRWSRSWEGWGVTPRHAVYVGYQILTRCSGGRNSLSPGLTLKAV